MSYITVDSTDTFYCATLYVDNVPTKSGKVRTSFIAAWYDAIKLWFVNDCRLCYRNI